MGKDIRRMKSCSRIADFWILRFGDCYCPGKKLKSVEPVPVKGFDSLFFELLCGHKYKLEHGIHGLDGFTRIFISAEQKNPCKSIITHQERIFTDSFSVFQTKKIRVYLFNPVIPRQCGARGGTIFRQKRCVFTVVLWRVLG